MSLLTPALVRALRATAFRGISMSACKTRLQRLDTLLTLLPAGVIPRSYDRLIDLSTKMLQGGNKLSEGLTRMLSCTTRFPDGLYSEQCSCFSESVVPCGARVSTSLYSTKEKTLQLFSHWPRDKDKKLETRSRWRNRRSGTAPCSSRISLLAPFLTDAAVM
jgi:hypothetical protein